MKNELNILSILDINKYCENQKVNVNHLYSGVSPYNPNNSAVLINNIINNELVLYYKEKEKLDEIKNLPVFFENKIYTIEEYSSFYRDYFGADLPSDCKFNFEDNIILLSIFEYSIFWKS